MEKNKKELRICSIGILVFVALAIANIIIDLCKNGLGAAGMEGIEKQILEVMGIIVLVINFIVLIPQVFVGVKGLKISFGSASGKAHIVWAIILAVVAGLAIAYSVVDVIRKPDASAWVALSRACIELMFYAFYITAARKIASEE